MREDCDRYGMPLVIWAYPRGSAIKAKGGQDSFYAIDYAARMAMEMGADVVKLNLPKIDPETDKDSPAPYNELEVTQEEAVRQVVESAGRSLVVLSGGSKIDDDQLLEQTRYIMECGRLGRDLRAQRLAARAVRGGRDHRADQGDHARQRAPDPVAGARQPPGGVALEQMPASRLPSLASVVVLIVVAVRAADLGRRRRGRRASSCRRRPRPR